jgi:hypothetical protein
MKVVISIIEDLSLKYGFKCNVAHKEKELGIFYLQREYVYIALDIEYKDEIKVNMVSRPYKIIPIWTCSINELEGALKERLSLF